MDQSAKNPLRIDNNLLDELGLANLPAEEKANFLKHIYETLEMRVGMRLADQMTNEQLDEFETFYNAKDDAGAFRWLETNFPNYKDIVADEFQKLKGEIASSAPQILAASQQQTDSAPAPQPEDSQQYAPQPAEQQQPPQIPPAAPPQQY
jgi:predicted RNA-binding Zn ribbon-like protein